MVPAYSVAAPSPASAILHFNGLDTIAGPVALLLAGASAVAYVRQHRAKIAAAKVTTPTAPPTHLTAFGVAYPYPHWLGWKGTRALVPFIDDNGQHRLASVPTVSDRNMMLEALIESVRYAQHRRGLPVRDAENRRIVPQFRATGLLVERIENADGSAVELIATTISHALEPGEYAAAWQEGIGRDPSTWRNGPGEPLGKYDEVDETPLSGMTNPNRAREVEQIRRAKAKERRAYEADKAKARHAFPLYTVQIEKVATAAPKRANPFAPPATEKGSAQFAWVDEMLSSDTARLGSLRPSGAGFPLGLFRVRDWGNSSDARAGVVSTRWNGRDGEHRVIVGPPGSGKFTSVIAPLLLSSDLASVVVFDVANGEATKLAALHRSTLGPVLVLDPFGLSGVPSGGLNPLDVLRPDSPDLIETAKRLRDAIFVPQGKSSGTDSFFNDNASELLDAILLHVATWKYETIRTLGRVREIIRAPLFEYQENERGHMVAMPCDELLEMKANTAAGGIIADTARSVIASIQAESFKTLDGITRTLKANTAFLDLPSVQKVTERTTMDLRELRQRVSSLFVVVPEHQLRTVGRWLRLVYAVVAEACRYPSPKVPLHFILDEFPALGKFERVADDMALVRKFGVSYHVVVQSLVQLKNLYHEGWETFMATAKFKQILGVNDQQTAQWVSVQLGKTTRASTSESASRSTGGGGSSASKSWAAVDLLSPDELARLPRHEVIILVENRNPLRLRKLNWFESAHLSARAAK